MKTLNELRERFQKTKTMKDIMRVHGRALKKAERSGNLELPNDVEDALKSWVFKNEPYVGDDPDDFDEWLDNNLEDIVKGKIKESVEENKMLGGDTNFKVVEVKSGMIRLEFVNVRNGDILMKKDDFKKLQKFIKTVKV